jgi:CO/xanthine dehydrogenase FAD-binding subunit
MRSANLASDEIITAIELPPEGFARNYTYLKIRDRLSYTFALVSVAAGLKLEGGAIKGARLALGGVAHRPGACQTPKSVLRASGRAERYSARWSISFCRAPLPITASRSSLRAARSCEPSNRRRLLRPNPSP